MNRRQRRAAQAGKQDFREIYEAADKFIGSVRPGEEREDRRYLMLSMRPMTIADLVPGHPYEPGMMMLEVNMPATASTVGYIYQVPLLLPPELREPTPENTKTAYALAYATDPEAREMFEELMRRARPWREVAEVRGMPMETPGRIVNPRPSFFCEGL